MNITDREYLDRVWSLSGVIPENAVILPYRFSIGDSRMIFVNSKKSHIVGYRVKICSPVMKRLIVKIRW